VRSDVPGPLEHASGEVDEFDAALVRGAGGRPAEEQAAEQEELREEATSAFGGGAGGTGGGRRGGLTAVGGGGGDGAGAAEVRRPVAVPEQPRPSLVARAVAFLRASWAELQRVQWPDRRHVAQATAVVLGFVVVAGVYLGVADWVAQKIVNFIL
jgi:preprotein translocase SecE subunit